MPRRVTILGSTGSIGENTIDLIARDPEGFDIVALTGGRNVARLAQQAKALRAGIAVTAHEELYAPLKQALAGTGIEAAAGADAIADAAMRPADWVMSAIVGIAGLVPGLRALEQGATLALANKETLVAAGALVLRQTRAHGATLLPVDSEHSAVFQVLTGEDIAAVERIVITASGGPFRTWSREALANATLDQASVHPNWNMGRRITIDCASLFNKALEIIETKEFFQFDPNRIEVLIHPQSLIHAMVGFCDGALMAHVGPADMRHAIGYALHWPDRVHVPVERLDLARIGSMSFEAPDPERFPALRLAREVMAAGGLAGAAFNAAKEAALDLFVTGRIGFLRMTSLVEDVLSEQSGAPGFTTAELTLDNVLAMDRQARAAAFRLAG
ncbi:MAG: 1-deoxy-D-xylulose-5-phosphate reductoisomerase [Pseudomonadota bacterium]